jgi:hypothetical protein
MLHSSVADKFLLAVPRRGSFRHSLTSLVLSSKSFRHCRINIALVGLQTPGCCYAGTAVGIATAFGAPIGGLLFAFEELANSFSQALGWQIFFACMLAVLTLDTFKSAQHALNKGHFGLFDGDASTVFFEVCTHPSPFQSIVLCVILSLPRKKNAGSSRYNG